MKQWILPKLKVFYHFTRSMLTPIYFILFVKFKVYLRLHAYFLNVMGGFFKVVVGYSKFVEGFLKVAERLFRNVLL